MNSKVISNLANPVEIDDATNRAYVDLAITRAINNIPKDPNVEEWEPVLAQVYQGNGTGIQINNVQIGDRYKFGASVFPNGSNPSIANIIEFQVFSVAGSVNSFTIDNHVIQYVFINGNVIVTSNDKKLQYSGFNKDGNVNRPVVLRCRRDYSLPTTFLPENKGNELYGK